MALCHECGSEVAENDQFCPFCGIALLTAGPEAEDDASFESTIIMPPPPKAAKVEESPAPENKPAEPTIEEAPARDDFDDVPTPIALQNLESTAGSLFSDVGSSSESSEPEPQPPPIGSQGLNRTEEEPQPESFAPEKPQEALPEIASFEPPAIETPANESMPPVAESLDVQSSLPTPEEPIHAAGNDGLKISKPLDVPIPEDRHSAPSKFDSVRIMDNSDVGNMPFNAGTLQNEPTNIAPPPSSRLGSGQDRLSGVRPQTSSKIGIVDTDGRRALKLKPLEEGTMLNGRYEIVRKIGGGGMGAVYLASDNNLGGVLRAVKEMVQSHIEEEQQEKAINDFKRESMILSTLDHPSIPTIYDYFFDEKESRFYLVMKYISGGDLASRLRAAPEGKIDERTVIEWAIQISDVLDYLHNQPTTIVYRDLKPSNIMIDGNSGRVMLIDFGIARSIHQKEEKGVTAVGTMGYAPPELFSGNVEPRSDIYSLGSTMFHLLTGADPQSNPLLIFDFQKNPRPRQINPQLSDQIERVLMRSVEYNAASRFASAAEFRQVLDDHLQNLKRGNVTFGVKEIPASVSLANQNVFCGFCGQKIVATDLFCAFCGSKQPIAQQGVHSEIYAPAAPMTARLVVVGTSELDSPMFKLEKSENLIGRRDPMSNIFPEVDLSKFDPQTKISRRHAKIWREGSTFLVEDLGSSNGTVLFTSLSDSLRLLPHQPRPLSSGDKIKLGDTTLHFVLG